jgi:two-component system, OmpR family, sensor histidine kinase PhoQ
MNLSLRGRLILAASLTLIAFLGLTGAALEGAYRESVEDALRERLEAQVYSLLGAAQEDAHGRLRIPDALPDPRLMAADSGLYAEVAGAAVGEGPSYRWRSASLLGSDPVFLRPVAPGERRFGRVATSAGDLFGLSFGILWEDAQGNGLAYTVAVAEEVARLEQRVGQFRVALFGGLGGAALLLLLAQAWVLHWGLWPLRRLAEELGEIEAGRADTLRGGYPQELAGVTHNLNSLLRHSRANLERQRHRLGDLAHSLKTPLAVLQGALEQDDATLREAVREQLPRLGEIVGYQLQRAAAGGGCGALLRALPLEAPLGRVVAALHKVYREKGVSCRMEIAPGARFRGDEGDLYELLGNLLDNAFKYCRGEVRIVAAEGPAGGLRLIIADDGPGIPAEAHDRVLRRGQRGDQQTSGQGIGLGVVAEIVHLYGGRLEIAQGALGGAEIRLAFTGVPGG